MGKTAEVHKLPLCDFCPGDTEKAEYDFKTKQGAWANGCQLHYMIHRLYADLGTGKGQRLIAKARA